MFCLTTGLQAVESADHRLKPQAKTNPSPLNLFLPGICHRDKSLINTGTTLYLGPQALPHNPEAVAQGEDQLAPSPGC
jgi:hypothetical protein